MHSLPKAESIKSSKVRRSAMKEDWKRMYHTSNMFDIFLFIAASVAHTVAEALLTNAPFRKDYRRIYEHLRRLQNAYNDNNRKSQYSLLAYIFHILSLEPVGEIGKKCNLESIFREQYDNDLTNYLIKQLLSKVRNDPKLAGQLSACLLDGATEHTEIADDLCKGLLAIADTNAVLSNRLLDHLLDRLKHDPIINDKLFERLKSCQIICRQ